MEFYITVMFSEGRKQFGEQRVFNGEVLTEVFMPVFQVIKKGQFLLSRNT